MPNDVTPNDETPDFYKLGLEEWEGLKEDYERAHLGKFLIAMFDYFFYLDESIGTDLPKCLQRDFRKEKRRIKAYRKSVMNGRKNRGKSAQEPTENLEEPTENLGENLIEFLP